MFRKELFLTRPHSVLFYLTGQGGVGKSTLLDRSQEIARGSGYLVAETDEYQRDIPTVLGQLAQQLADQDHPLKTFDKQYKLYQQKMHEVENDPKAPQGIASLFGRTLVHAAFMAGDAIPVVRKGLDLLPQDRLTTQAGEWSEYIAKKYNNKDEAALVRDPVAH